MRLVSWNVNGLRAVMRKNFDEVLAALAPDAFCLQEIKLSDGQIDGAREGYEDHWNYAVRRGYSGTAVYTRSHPLSVMRGVGSPEHDDEGRALTLEYPDFYLVNVYAPNSQTELARLDYRLRWEDALLSHVTALDRQKPVAICGDLNVAHNDIDLRNPATNHANPGFSHPERAAFARLLDAGFVDTFRALHPAEQRFSWWSYRYGARAKGIGWRIDYFLVSARLMPHVRVAAIHDDVTGSDHCPVSVEINL